MKKVLSLALIILSVLALTGCSETTSKDESGNEKIFYY